MSSILKALRRLEEERARKSSVAPEIAASLLRSSVRRRPTFLWIWPTVITVAAAVAMALFWSWRPAPVVSQAVTPVPSPATIASTITASRGGTLIIEEVIDQRRPVLLPPPPAPHAAGEQVAPAMIPPVAVRLPASPPTAERLNPVVSAIAWQEDASARMAVVDGLPVMTGESVGTAKIQEIQRDRVLFAEGETLFTVSVAPP